MYIAGFDIGLKNFAIWVEEFKEIPKCEVKNKYKKSGEPTDEFQEYLNNLVKSGRRVYVNKVDLSTDNDIKVVMKVKNSQVKIQNRKEEACLLSGESFEKKKVEKTVDRHVTLVSNSNLVKLTRFLSSIKELLDKIDCFVIEKQMKSNPKAEQLQYHLRSFLLINYFENKEIILFPSTHKTQVLGAPKGLGNKERKTWASETVKKILELRKDTEGINEVFTRKKYGKADDVSDCLLHILAYIIMHK